MKGLKVTLAAAASALLLAAPAMAFHSGGVARCEGCHTMHNSLDGAAMGGGGKQAYANGTQFLAAGYLLQGNGSTSDACLVCHQDDDATGPSSYKVSTQDTDMDGLTTFPKQMGPGGDFGWINVNTGSKYKRGHNIMAPTHGYSADLITSAEPRFGANSPGGSYPKTSFNCASCHDPHGKYRNVKAGGVLGAEVTTGAPIVKSGSYNSDADITDGQALGVFRFLGGAGYSPKSLGGGHTFANAAPIAIVPSTYNKAEASTTNTLAAYGSGMSEWCANCHADLLENAYVSGEAGHTHPAGNSATLGATISGNYNAYISSGITGTGKYSSLVPYEQNGKTRAELKTFANLAATPDAAAAGTDNVSCLSCHRAHASGFTSMLRFEPAEFMTVDNAGTVVYSTDTPKNTMLTTAYYGRPASEFGAYQRALCNKCHAKD